MSKVDCLAVHQFNSSKPDKLHIDFFVLINATLGKNFIYHLDVYQGKNAMNAFIAEEAHNLPITQKAVLNATVLSGIANEHVSFHNLKACHVLRLHIIKVLLGFGHQIQTSYLETSTTCRVHAAPT